MTSTTPPTSAQILVVEDSDADFVILQSLLVELGYAPTSVLRARSLAEALRLITTSLVAVFTDLGLPDASGTEAVIRLAESHPTTALVVVSDQTDALTQLDPAGAPVADVISKSELTSERLSLALTRATSSPTGEELIEILERLPQAVLVLEDNGMIRFANPEAERLLGWPRASLTGHDISVIVPGHRPDHLLSFPVQPVRERSTVVMRSDGSLVDVEVSVIKLHGARVLLLTRDLVREIERAEREHKAHQALRNIRAIEQLYDVTTGVAHDLRNYLSAASGFADLLRDDVPDRSTEMIEQLRESLQAAMALATRLIGTAAGASRSMPVEVGPIIDQAVGFFAAAARRGLDIEVDVEPGLTVRTDRQELEAALVNLGLNAVEALGPHGTVIVTADQCTIASTLGPSELQPGRYVRITVADNGRGMAPEVAARAFEPYFTSRISGAGTGLGLARVRRLVAQAGGAVSLRSELGHGTAITIYLPAEDATHTLLTDPAPPPQPAHDRREGILIVAPDPSERELLKSWLRQAGFAAVTASGPSQAATTLRFANGSIVGVVACVHHPSEAAAVLAGTAKPRPDLPVLVVSDWLPRLMERFLVDGLDEWRTVRIERTPLDATRLVQIIDELIGRAGSNH
ncbi:MAG: ATP-binding protein [Acidimicrobiales bacterium]|nr:ATP-binding protein [Acidimicrobiales bacterium]